MRLFRQHHASRAAITAFARFSFLTALLALTARGDVSLAPIFVDHTVLQRDKVVPIWGRAAPQEKITVTFRNQTAHTTAANDGHWLLHLTALQPGAPARLTVSGNNTLVLEDVVVGDVWLCSGQSNMAWTVANSRNATAEIAAANFPLLRQFKPGPATAAHAAAARGSWVASSPQTVSDFTAVGYFFARDLHQQLGVPIGIVNCSWGGTPIEAWLSPQALASDPAFASAIPLWQTRLRTYPEKKAQYDLALADWEKQAAAAKAVGEAQHAAFLKQTPQPLLPLGPDVRWAPTELFNEMIRPLLPYALRGVIWYQGENNALRAYGYPAANYTKLFPVLITSWRAHFGQGDIPFYWVQLANYQTEEDWPTLREAQAKALTLSNTGMAVTIDIGEPDNIHPTNKQEVGRRLALIARHHLYNLPGAWSGPRLISAERDGASLRLRFDSVDGGLVLRDAEAAAGFSVAGADQKFHPASARIDGDTVIVSSPEVLEPVAVRYAWTSNPGATLFNGADLPAAPFRTDAW